MVADLKGAGESVKKAGNAGRRKCGSTAPSSRTWTSVEARAMLAEIFAQSTEASTPDLKEAKALLDEMSD